VKLLYAGPGAKNVGRASGLASYLAEGVKEQAVASPKHSFRFAGYVPNDTGARREVLLVWIVEIRKSARRNLFEKPVDGMKSEKKWFLSATTP